MVHAKDKELTEALTELSRAQDLLAKLGLSCKIQTDGTLCALMLKILKFRIIIFLFFVKIVRAIDYSSSTSATTSNINCGFKVIPVGLDPLGSLLVLGLAEGELRRGCVILSRFEGILVIRPTIVNEVCQGASLGCLGGKSRVFVKAPSFIRVAVVVVLRWVAIDLAQTDTGPVLSFGGKAWTRIISGEGACFGVGVINWRWVRGLCGGGLQIILESVRTLVFDVSDPST
ncbi:hypothetical protein Fot_35181 [Forsythia ovata]|uniref:Uncharacterized protein n=1 Tax=Forsythia ovata TaxID=205694 RepID=A0ABD1SKU1_9LAMI